jgi:hypothetical protein
VKRFIAFVTCEDGFEVSFSHYPDPDEKTYGDMCNRARGDFMDHFPTEELLQVRIEVFPA